MINLPTISFSYTSPDRQLLESHARRLSVSPPRDLSSENALGCIAVAIYHESRNEPTDGLYGVATVILNRSYSKRWPSHPCDVVRQPAQFSFMTSLVDFPEIRKGKSWNRSIKAAAYVLYNGPLESYSCSDHYHADYVDPSWNKSMITVKKVGLHIFYCSN